MRNIVGAVDGTSRNVDLLMESGGCPLLDLDPVPKHSALSLMVCSLHSGYLVSALSGHSAYAPVAGYSIELCFPVGASQ